MKKITEGIGALLAIALLLGVGFCGGYHYASKEDNMETIPVQEDTTDLVLPGETQERVITSEEIQIALIEIQDITTYAGKYTVSKSEDEVRKEFGWDMFGVATNSIALKCQGVVKVGFDMNEITLAVDNESKTVYIKVPQPIVLDNYVIWDSVECTEVNNILNPIEFSQYQTIIAEMEEEGLIKTENEGVYDAAREHFEAIVVRYLSRITDYEIVIL